MSLFYRVTGIMLQVRLKKTKKLIEKKCAHTFRENFHLNFMNFFFFHLHWMKGHIMKRSLWFSIVGLVIKENENNGRCENWKSVETQ